MTCDSCRLCLETPVAYVLSQDTAGGTIVMSQDIGDSRTCVVGVRLLLFVAALSSGWSSGGLVVVSGVDDQFAEEFAGGGVDDADV